ncbi:MAG: DUF2973 domain-containing protein [cyanobacterium endosymbiont of Rhopalodia sterrenbergii]
MLHLLYVLTFTVIVFFVVSNLIRSLIKISIDFQHRHIPKINTSTNRENAQKTIHPELLDEIGNPSNEPLLLMRSVTVEDIRQQLDALYNLSPNQSPGKEKES